MREPNSAVPGEVVRQSRHLTVMRIGSTSAELVSMFFGLLRSGCSIRRATACFHRGGLSGVSVILCVTVLSVVAMSQAQADESVKKDPDAKSIGPVKPPIVKSGSEKVGAAKSEKKAANRAAPGKSSGSDSTNSVTEPVPPPREAAAMAFAQQYHPELAELLTRLRDSNSVQFAKAIRELDQTRERLEKTRERDPERYSIMLHEWQLDSRVRLLAARLTMSTSAELETELRQVLTERHDVRLQLLTYDRERSKARLQKMDEQITEHVQSRDATVDRELDRIKKNADVRKRTMKPATKRPPK